MSIIFTKNILFALRKRKLIYDNKLLKRFFSSNIKNSIIKTNDKYNLGQIHKNEIITIINHIEILNLPKNKILRKEELELLLNKRRNKYSRDNNIIKENYTNDENQILISLQYLIINYENYIKFIELGRYSNNNINKNESNKIEIIKKEDRFIINFHNLTKKNIYLGILFNRKIRLENSDKFNNLMFLFIL